LGLELLEPFAVRDKEREAITAAKQENEELRSTVTNLMEQVAKLTEAMTAMNTPQVNKGGRPKKG